MSRIDARSVTYRPISRSLSANVVLTSDFRTINARHGDAWHPGDRHAAAERVTAPAVQQTTFPMADHRSDPDGEQQELASFWPRRSRSYRFGLARHPVTDWGRRADEREAQTRA
jgi:hypothetical protein